MHKTTFIILALIFAGKLFAQDIILLHTNDLHSKLNGYSPELEYTPQQTGDDMTVGGFARIAGYIQQIRTENPNDIVLAVDAGDFLMGSLFHPLEKNTGFQLRLMKEMGYDYLTLGNHEFDYGPGSLAHTINKAKEKGEIPQILLTNVEFDKKDSRDDALEALFNDGTIKHYAIENQNNVRIAFLGIIGYDAEEVQPFLPPVEITDPIKAVKKTSKDLIKNDIADLVIVLSHSGVKKEDGEWQGEDVDIAKKASPYIHAIISGHTHTKLEKPIIEKEVPIVQTGSGGKNIGKLIIQNNNETFTLKSHELIPVNDDIQAIMTIQDKIDKQNEMVQRELLSPLNIQYGDAVCETSFNMECHEEGDLHTSTLGPLLADAIQYYVTDAGYKSDMSLIAAGVVRDQLRAGKNGQQNIADLFRIVSLGEGEDNIPGYALAQVYITGKELKSVLEVLLMTQTSKPSTHCFFSGIRVEANMDGGFLKRVKNIELGNDIDGWETLDHSKKNEKLYAVTANAYMLTFLSMIKQKSFGLVNVKPKDINGEPIEDMVNQYLDFDKTQDGVQEGKEWIAFYHYVSSFPDTNGNGIPDIPEIRKKTFNPVNYIEHDK